MTIHADWQELHDVLERLEVALETPFVPGELETWVGNALSAFESVEPVLTKQIDVVHAERFAEIADEDPELYARVENLRAGDRASLENWAKLRDRLATLSSQVAAVEPDEAAVEPELEAFRDATLEFVIHVRKQEVATNTWLLEAIERDRGSVD